MGVDADFWRDRRVLITGHSGFKGSWLVLWLQSLGARVSGFSAVQPSGPSLYELARVGEALEQSVDGDVCDADATDAALARCRPEVVIHMAAQALVRRSLHDPRETYATNVMGTVNVLDAIRREPADVRAVLVVSSDKCYENREWEWGYREDEPLGGSDPYSSSKACAELVTAAFRRSFFSDRHGPQVATARAGNVIGGGDFGEDRLVPDVVRAALAGERVLIRNPDSVRPWQHVLNPLSGYLVVAQALARSAEHAGAWNFGPDDRETRPVRWIVERLAELWPRELDWAVDEREQPHEAHQLRLDSSRARARLGWRAPVALDRALASIVEWHTALADGADMREVTAAQIEALLSQ